MREEPPPLLYQFAKSNLEHLPLLPLSISNGNINSNNLESSHSLVEIVLAALWWLLHLNALGAVLALRRRVFVKIQHVSTKLNCVWLMEIAQKPSLHCLIILTHCLVEQARAMFLAEVFMHLLIRLISTLLPQNAWCCASLPPPPPQQQHHLQQQVLQQQPQLQLRPQ